MEIMDSPIFNRRLLESVLDQIYKVLQSTLQGGSPRKGYLFQVFFKGVGISQVKVHEKEESDLGIQKGLVFNIAFELITVLPSRPV